jgi:MFS family permease
MAEDLLAERMRTPGSARLSGQTLQLSTSYFATYLGDGLYYVSAALYFTRVVGFSPFKYGAALTAAWLVAMVLGVPVGHLADRFAPRNVAIVLLLLNGLVVCAYLVTHELWFFLVFACVFATCTEGCRSARTAFIARIYPTGQVTRVRAILISVSNAGLALGAALGALVIAVNSAASYRIAFGADAATFFIAATLLLMVPSPQRAATGSVAGGGQVPAAEGQTPEHDGKAQAAKGSMLDVFRDRGYVAVGFMNMVLTLHVPLIDVALPLWIVRETRAPEWIIGVVFTVTTVLVVFFQYKFAKQVTGISEGLRTLRLAGVLLFLGMVLYACSGLARSPWTASGALLAGAAVVTFGEMRQTASMNEISFRLVPGN